MTKFVSCSPLAMLYLATDHFTWMHFKFYMLKSKLILTLGTPVCPSPSRNAPKSLPSPPPHYYADDTPGPLSRGLAQKPTACSLCSLSLLLQVFFP